MDRGGLLLLTLVVSSFLAVFGQGCGSDADSGGSGNTSSGSTGSGNPEGVEACARYIAARRDVQTTCGTEASPSRQSEYFARHQRRCETMVAAPGSGITAAVIDQCTADVRTACAGVEACTKILDAVRGSLADGAGCVYGSQCASGKCKKEVSADGAAHCGKCVHVKEIGEPCQNELCVFGAYCLSPTPKEPVVCIAPRVLAEGDPCGGLDPVPGACAKGLDCRPAVNGLPRICVRPAGAGETCGESNGLICVPPLACLNERCSPYFGAGEACPDGRGCAPGLRCDEASKTCTSVVWVPIGADCSGSLRECDRGYCFAPGTSTGTATGGTCIDYVADGQACAGGDFGDGEPNGPACDVTAACRDKRCQLDDPSLCR